LSAAWKRFRTGALAVEILILTVPGRPYAAQLLDEIDRQAPTSRKTIFVDGLDVSSQVSRPGWLTAGALKVPGSNNAHAFFQALAHTVGDTLYLEDDLEAAPDAIECVERQGCPPEMALVAHFDVLFRAGTPRGLYEGPGGSFLHCQAVFYPRRTVAKLLAWRAANPYRLDLGMGADQAVALALDQKWVGYSVPNCFQHLGAVSVSRPGRAGFPQSETFNTRKKSHGFER
jgi:hypothetical protein